MNDNKIKVIILEHGKLARVAMITAALAAMREVVQGDVEIIYPFEEDVCIVCNENGKISGLPMCRVLLDDDREIRDVICGPAFICSYTDEGFGSLNDEQLDKYLRQFRYPERLFLWN